MQDKLNTYPETVRSAAETKVGERGPAWDVAMGQQAVDELEGSEYLREMVGDQIKGLISFDEVPLRMDAYFPQQGGGCSISAEADIVVLSFVREVSETVQATGVEQH